MSGQRSTLGGDDLQRALDPKLHPRTPTIFTLIKDAVVYGPERLGRRDVLLVAGTIAAVAEHLDPLPVWATAEVVDAAGKLLAPGLIDLHLHFIGGGGELGPHSRTPEATLTTLTMAGITTAVGVLGTDSQTRHLSSLLAKARGLEREGVSAYIYTGAYDLPSPTLTGSVRDDLVLIDKVVGVKVAVSDHRGTQPTHTELAKLAAGARVGGLLAGKPGVVHVHVGAGPRGLAPLREVIEQTELPISQFVPTHLLRTPDLFDQALRWLEDGGYVDLTTGAGERPGRAESIDSDVRRPRQALDEIARAGLDTRLVTWSSDGQGSLPRFDRRTGALRGMGIGTPRSLLDEVRRAVVEDGLDLAEVLPVVTANPAARIGLADSKGRVAPGYDADLLLLDPNTLELDRVWARGKLLVADGGAVEYGMFDRPNGA